AGGVLVDALGVSLGSGRAGRLLAAGSRGLGDGPSAAGGTRSAQWWLHDSFQPADYRPRGAGPAHPRPAGRRGAASLRHERLRRGEHSLSARCRDGIQRRRGDLSDRIMLKERFMILTIEQLKAVREGKPLRFTAPETSSEFVLLPA